MSVRMPKFHAPAQLTRTAKAARSPLVQGCVSCAYALHSKASLQAARAYVQTSCAHVIVTYTVHEARGGTKRVKRSGLKRNGAKRQEESIRAL